jgi:CBS domain-containing protein
MSTDILTGIAIGKNVQPQSSESSNWKALLRNTKVSSILEQGRLLVKAQYFEEVADLLKKMSDAKILSAVVVDPDPKVGVVGFVDVLDLMVYVIDIADQSGRDITKESMANLKWEGQCFVRQNIGSLVNVSRANPLYKISADASLEDAVQLMAAEVHRLAVLDESTPSHYISNIISQSDIVNFIASRGWGGSKMSKRINEAGLAPLGVATVLESNNVIAVLRYMRDYKIGGVGVVDSFGRLVANFSATDLLGLTADKFSMLALPVKEFLLRIHGGIKEPVVTTSADTIATLMNKFVEHKIHRVYIVDNQMIPIGVISMTDIMQFLLSE